MLQPKRVKYRKSQRGKLRGMAHAGSTLVKGDFGLKTLDSYWLTARQIEAARRAITHHVKRGGDLMVRVFPDKAVSKKPLEVRQGGGKGAVDHWVAPVKRGRILFELSGVSEADARAAMRLAASKLPVTTKFISREGVQATGA